MKKFGNLLHKKERKGASNGSVTGRRTSEYAQGSPEDVAAENVILFCQGGSNNRVSRWQRPDNTTGTDALDHRMKKSSICRHLSLLPKPLLQLLPLLVVR